MPIANDIFDTLPSTPYAAARDQICNGDILLCSGTEPFSELIKAATSSLWSHVGFIWRVADVDRILVLESVENAGCRAIALSSKINGVADVHDPYKGRMLIARHAQFASLVDTAKFTDMTRFAVDRFGAPYAPLEVARIAARIGLGMLKRPMAEPLKPQHEYICSEYAAECYGAIGITIAWNGDGFIAPCDFALDPEVSAVLHITPDP
jgi:hypothetical protein